MTSENAGPSHAAAGFQVGVQRAVEATPEQLWELITSRPELWLGEGTSVTVEPGARFQVQGASGEIREVEPGERLRLSWLPTGWTEPATLQLSVRTGKSGTTALQIQIERLPDALAKEAMRVRWRQTLERISAAVRSDQRT